MHERNRYSRTLDLLPNKMPEARQSAALPVLSGVFGALAGHTERLMTHHNRALKLTGKRTSQINDILNILLEHREAIADEGALRDFQELITDILRTDIEMIETLNNIEQNSAMLADEIIKAVQDAR